MSAPPVTGGAPAGPTDPAARRRWLAERRAAARRHHPDRGGSTDALLQAWADVDARYDVGTGRRTAGGRDRGDAGHDVVVLAPPWWRRLARRLADGTDLLRRPSVRWIDVPAPTTRPAPPARPAPPRGTAARDRARHGGRP